MDAHTAGVHSFAEAVMMNSTPEPRRWTDVARFCSLEGGDSALEEYATLPEGAACMAS